MFMAYGYASCNIHVFVNIYRHLEKVAIQNDVSASRCMLSFLVTYNLLDLFNLLMFYCMKSLS